MILIVEDDHSSAVFFSAALEKYQTRVVSDVAGALRAIAQAKPDLILLDINLGGLHRASGYDLLRDPAVDGIPVIVASAHTEPEYEATILAAGAADFVAKPVDPVVLRARVAARLR